MARIPYFDPAGASPEVLEVLETLPHLKDANILRMVAQADSIFVYYLGFAGRLITQLELDMKLRELAILLVSRRTEADYEWVQHTAIARAIGIPQEQIDAVEADELTADCLGSDARAVLGFTAAVIESPKVDEETFAAMREVLSPREVVELMLVIGHYFMLARIITALEVDPDAPLGTAAIEETATTIDGS
jgi:4-carboxymuconolactone decarboxylase